MTPHLLRPLTSRDWEPPKPPGFRIARMALLFQFVLHLGGASWNLYRGVVRISPEHLLQFLWDSVAYPAAVAALAGLAMWWLRAEREAGAWLGAGLVGVYGGRILVDALSGEGPYPSVSSRIVGQLFLGAFASIFLCASVVLALAGRAFRKHEVTAEA